MWMRVAKSVKKMSPDEPEIIEETPLPEYPMALQSDPPGRLHGRTHATSDDLEKLIGGFAPSRNIASIAADKSNPQKPGYPADRAMEKRVRRGRISFGSTLDLHGHTQLTGRTALLQFVAWHRGQGETSVLVITGKGRDGDGILKRRFLEWIAEPDLRVHISGYSRANQKHGGDGAFYLFLRRLTT